MKIKFLFFYAFFISLRAGAQADLEVISVTYYTPCRIYNNQFINESDAWIDIYEDGLEYDQNNPDGYQKKISGDNRRTIAWQKTGETTPVAYVSGYLPRASAKFDFIGNNQCGISGTPIYVRAVQSSGGGYEVVLPPKKINLSTLEYEITPFEKIFCDSKFETEVVHYYDNFPLEWQYCNALGQQWYPAGTSHNPVYVTHRKPLANIDLNSKYPITVIDLGCSAADGNSDIQTIVEEIFTEFMDRCVSKKGSGNCMQYWGDYSGGGPTNFDACRNLPQFLEEEDARCGEWRKFLLALMSLHGVFPGQNILEADYGSKKRGITAYSYDFSNGVGFVPGAFGGPVDAVDDLFNKLTASFGPLFHTSDPFNDNNKVFMDGGNSLGVIGYFFVKNWTFPSGENNLYGAWLSGGGQVVIEDWDGNGPYQSQTINGADQTGLPAQGMANPQPYFSDHVVLNYNGKIYDPSYGTLYQTEQDWANANLAGFGTIVYYRDQNFMVKSLVWLHKTMQSGNYAIFSDF